jgi:hypothetical protein
MTDSRSRATATAVAGTTDREEGEWWEEQEEGEIVDENVGGKFR